MTNTLFKRTGSLLILLFATAALTGCDPKKADDTATPGTDAGKKAPASVLSTAGAATYKMITNNSSPFWETMGKGMDEAKTSLKVNGDRQAPTPPDNNQQVTLLKDAVSAKSDGIGISPINPDALVPAIDDTIKAGVPVICFDSDAPKSKRLAYIGTNNYDAGKAAGAAILKLFPNGGKLVAFVGEMSAQNARDRYQGILDSVQGHNIEFLQAPYEDKTDKARSRSNVEDAITKYSKQINGFVGLWSYNGPGIINAVKAAGIRKDVKIICFDGDPGTLKGLAEGDVDATIVQKPYEFGRISLLLLDAYKTTKDINKAIEQIKPELDKIGAKATGTIIDTGVTTVTPENAPAFLKELKDKGLETT